MADDDSDERAAPGPDAGPGPPEPKVDETIDERARRRHRRERADTRRFFDALEAHDRDESEHALRALSTEIRDELIGPDSYVPVLFFTMAIVVLVPIGPDSVAIAILTILLALGTLLLTLRRSYLRPEVLRIVVGLATVAAGVGVVNAVMAARGETPQALGIAAAAMFTLLLLMTLPAMLRRVLLARKVTVTTLAGALCAYLLLGLMFSSMFRVIALSNDNQFFAQKSEPRASDFEYFSFITITTVGYGDLSPGTDAARSGAIFEAVIGQVFLVTIVARVVGNLGQERASQLPAGGGTPAADGAGGDDG